MSAIHTIAYFGLDQALDLISPLPTDLDRSNATRFTPLQYAILSGSYCITRYLLASCPYLDVNREYDADGEVPLALALCDNNFRLVELLLEYGADPNSRDVPPIVAAARSGNLPAVEYFSNIDGVDINRPSVWGGRNALEVAAESGFFEIVKALVNAGADLDSSSKRTRATKLAMGRKHDEIAKYLICKEASTAWLCIETVHAGRQSIVQLHLKQGCDVNEATLAGETAMHVAARAGELSTLEMLIAAGGDPGKRMKSGTTPLHRASQRGYDLIRRRLLELDVDVDAAEEHTLDTPLLLAVSHEQQAMVEMLLEFKASINHRNYAGNISLAIAAMRGYTDIAQVLLSNGADPTTRNGEGKSPLELAKLNGKKEMILLFENYAKLHENLEGEENADLV